MEKLVPARLVGRNDLKNDYVPNAIGTKAGFCWKKIAPPVLFAFPCDLLRRFGRETIAALKRNAESINTIFSSHVNMANSACWVKSAIVGFLFYFAGGGMKLPSPSIRLYELNLFQHQIRICCKPTSAKRRGLSACFLVSTQWIAHLVTLMFVAST